MLHNNNTTGATASPGDYFPPRRVMVTFNEPNLCLSSRIIIIIYSSHRAYGLFHIRLHCRAPKRLPFWRTECVQCACRFKHAVVGFDLALYYYYNRLVYIFISVWWITRTGCTARSGVSYNIAVACATSLAFHPRSQRSRQRTSSAHRRAVASIIYYYNSLVTGA